MFDNLSQRLQAITDKGLAYNLRLLLEPLFSRTRSCMLSTAGLVIKVGGSTLAKTGAITAHYIADGVKGRILSSTDMPALTGLNIANGKWNVIVFTVDKAGTVRAQIGKKDATTEAGIQWPELDQRRAIIGMIVINAATGAFTGGTTPLDDATLAVQYISPIGSFDPSVKI
jgi:hypothetical protein